MITLQTHTRPRTLKHHDKCFCAFQLQCVDGPNVPIPNRCHYKLLCLSFYPWAAKGGTFVCNSTIGAPFHLINMCDLSCSKDHKCVAVQVTAQTTCSALFLRCCVARFGVSFEHCIKYPPSHKKQRFGVNLTFFFRHTGIS